MTESKMDSKGTKIFCTECGKEWEMDELGRLKATGGETEFSHIPDWFEWEREQVKQQILRGEYRYEDEVDVYSFPRCYRFIPLGKAKVCHSFENGFTSMRDLADAITSFSWAQYCYNAALKMGNSILSESLMARSIRRSSLRTSLRASLSAFLS